MGIDRILLDGSDAYQAPVPGTVGSATSGGPVKAQLAGAGMPLELLVAQPPVPGARLAGLAWQAAAGAREIAEGEVFHPQTVITGRHFGPDPAGDVLIDQHVRLIDGSGDAAHQAAASWRAARSELPAPDKTTDDIASPEWGALLAERLAADAEFASSTSTLDGSIGLVSRQGGETARVEFRIYRGSIIETGRKSLDGPTYAIEADALTWAELVTGRHDDYVRFAAQGRFTVRGSGFQYLRLSKTTRIMIWHARTMRQEARNG
ncbi:MAG TPA: hypothetical protein VGG83_20995 [Trebonia sp.]|jgi:hypothetical protein